MSRLVGQFTLLVSTTMLGGCAYLTNYTRSIDLGGSSAVSMDVKQRVVFSQKLPAAEGALNQVVVCAEPSPDAMTVLGASGGLSLNDAMAEKSLGASASFAETGAFVGLRTQSIQLLRDAMYRLCEGYAGGGVTAAEFASMQRRYQSTMMGLISIEQLTRPVVAGQMALASSASSSAGAAANDAAQAKAQAQVDAKAKEVDTAQDGVREAQAKLDSARAELDQKDIAIARAKAEKDSKAVADTLLGERPALVQKRDAADRGLLSAQAKLDTARDALRRAEAADAAARTQASSSAGGSARGDGNSKAVADVNSDLVDGVVAIVREINTSYTREGCFALVQKLVERDRDPLSRAAAASTAASASPPFDPVREGVELCRTILTAEAEAAKELAKEKREVALSRRLAAESRQRVDKPEDLAVGKTHSMPVPPAPAASSAPSRAAVPGLIAVPAGKKK